MAGWIIIIFREEGTANMGDPHRVAMWTTGLDGQDWLKRMVREGRAEFLDDNGGYPTRYAARWKELAPELRITLREEDGRAEIQEGSVIRGTVYYGAEIHAEVAARCGPEDRLIIHCWDST